MSEASPPADEHTDEDMGLKTTKQLTYEIPKEPGVALVAPTMSVATMIDKYLRLRDKKEEIIQRHKEELKPYNAAMDMLEGMLLSMMNELESDSFKSPGGDIDEKTGKPRLGGTAYKTMETRVNVQQWHQTLDFIKKHDVYELLEARVSKTVVMNILQETGEVVPGVKIVQRVNVNIRRA